LLGNGPKEERYPQSGGRRFESGQGPCVSDNRISACLIIRDDGATIRNLLEKLRPHVDEIVCVDTGSTDDSPAICRDIADKWEVFLGANDPATELIEDFALARNRSYEIASHPWALWCDGDDDIQGAENLRELCNRPEPAVQYLIPYEYSFDEQGRVTCLHWRENLIKPREACKWQIPVHEVLIPGVPMVIEPTQKFRRIHRKHLSKKAHEPGRNLRILDKYIARVGESDVRALYYYGVELHHAGRIPEAIRTLKRYVTIGTWTDELCLGMLELGRIYLDRLGQAEEAIEWAMKAMVTKSWPEPYWLLTRAFFTMGRMGQNTDYNFRRAAHFAELGMKMPDAQTVLFVNPMERYETTRILAPLLAMQGRIHEALDSAKAGLAVLPGDPQLMRVLLACEDMLTKNTLIREAQKLRALADQMKPLDMFDAGQWKMVGDAVGQLLEIAPVLPPAAEVVRREVPEQPKEDGCLDIVFYLGPAYEEWTPVTLAKGGMGGSETMAWELAKRLRAIGHRVRVFACCSASQEGVYDGVEWLQSAKYPGTTCDVMISSRAPHAVNEDANLKAAARVLWVHDVHIGNFTPAQKLRFDMILALSEWHRGYLCEVYQPEKAQALIAKLRPDDITVTRNGIDLSRFDAVGPRNPKRVVYSSSPDRGLTTLLEMWPAILAEEPEAELHCYYGTETWEKAAAMNQYGEHPFLSATALRRLKHQLRNAPRVTMHGRINGESLAREFLVSGVMAASHWFSETYGIVFAEAQAAGCYVVATPIAALNETVADRGTLVPGAWESGNPTQAERTEFVGAVIRAIRGEGQPRTREELQAYARENFGLDSLAKDWDVMLRGLVERVATDVVPRFRGVT
jgi:glycosyltransferase involved in cell wall biosynthesis